MNNYDGSSRFNPEQKQSFKERKLPLTGMDSVTTNTRLELQGKLALIIEDVVTGAGSEHSSADLAELFHELVPTLIEKNNIVAIIDRVSAGEQTKRLVERKLPLTGMDSVTTNTRLELQGKLAMIIEDVVTGVGSEHSSADLAELFHELVPTLIEKNNIVAIIERVKAK
jgi:hypothetical protein